MAKYDILIVGASTTGCWFAKKMAEQGAKVLVIEKNLPENVSRDYDIFHMGEGEMEQFGLTIPDENNPIREFRFERSNMVSPYAKTKIPGGYSPVIGMHKHDYIMSMAKQAQNAGAEFIYGASFVDFIYDDNKKISGAKYKSENKTKKVNCKLVADCSGIPSVARRNLPNSSVVENAPLTNKDILYVVLYYVAYNDKSINPTDLNGFFMQYKSWFAPAGEGYDGLMGIGAFFSYDYAEAVFENHFRKNANVPEYTLLKTEKGMTPYHRNLTSTVDDGFIAMGDAAFLTKPTCGEGCTSSLVHGEIAAEVIGKLLKAGKPLTKENMWAINTRYMRGQGKEFDSMRALLKGVITISYDEAEYMFNNGILFCDKILGGIDDGLNISGSDIAQIVGGIAKGIATKKIRVETVKNLLKALSQSDAVTKLYNTYPETYAGYASWKAKADKLWCEIGKLSDIVDPEIAEKLNMK